MRTLGVALLSIVPALAAGQEFPALQGSHRVLVTVDDLPIAAGRLHPDRAARDRLTRDLLAVLRKHDIKAVGFVTWANVKDAADEALLDSWLKEGHELGNHSYTHPDYSRTETEAYVADMEKARVTLTAFLQARGHRLRFFRFPYLREGDTPAKLARMRDWLQETGQQNVPVTIDTQDWSFEEPWVQARGEGDEARLARLGEDYQHALRLQALFYTAAGDALFERPTPQVLLLHANAVGAAQWDALFTWMKGRGFHFVAADHVLADTVFHEVPAFVGRYGGSFWDRIRHVHRVARAREQVVELLERQSAAWSRGDLAEFTSAYDDDVVFVSPTGVTRGRAAVLERYRQQYPDRAAMGTLGFQIVEIRDVWGPEVTPLGDATPGAVHGASVVARWSLARAGGSTSGHTLMVLHRSGNAWRIVHDASM